MTVELIASGRPCQICATRDAAQSHAIGASPRDWEKPAHVTLDPFATKEVVSGNPKREYKYTDDSPGGRVLTYTRPDVVYRIVEKGGGAEGDSRNWGEFCANCIRSAAETADGTNLRGLDILQFMLARAREGK